MPDETKLNDLTDTLFSSTEAGNAAEPTEENTAPDASEQKPADATDAPADTATVDVTTGNEHFAGDVPAAEPAADVAGPSDAAQPTDAVATQELGDVGPAGTNAPAAPAEEATTTGDPAAPLADPTASPASDPAADAVPVDTTASAAEPASSDSSVDPLDNTGVSGSSTDGVSTPPSPGSSETSPSVPPATDGTSDPLAKNGAEAPAAGAADATYGSSPDATTSSTPASPATGTDSQQPAASIDPTAPTPNIQPPVSMGPTMTDPTGPSPFDCYPVPQSVLKGSGDKPAGADAGPSAASETGGKPEESFAEEVKDELIEEAKMVLKHLEKGLGRVKGLINKLEAQ